jgi:hypothetical protein
MSDYLRKLYPQIVTTVGDIAYDASGNQVQYDKSAIQAAQAQAEQIAKDAKASALAKLTALGLTQAEVTALIG